MAEDREFEGRLWAVVGAGNRRYLGRVAYPACYRTNEEQDEPQDCPPFIELEEAYELMTVTQPVQVSPGQVGIQRKTMLFPYDTCGHPVYVRLRPSELSWAEDFHESDRDGYRQLLSEVRAQMEQARVQRLGLAVAQPNLPPNLKGGPFGRS